ncbi:hypothetical protein IRJ41_008828 [Triplophysa rosa]|uniref:Uncharacterized protein n=1 Tax=Triplophysa rosa TaxID=992332 RepID=A0A9W8C5V3_TRIRA|nr:hypothetical protein IRJ41_008828 [Triplophysa rosa]
MRASPLDYLTLSSLSRCETQSSREYPLLYFCCRRKPSRDLLSVSRPESAGVITKGFHTPLPIEPCFTRRSVLYLTRLFHTHRLAAFCIVIC